MARLGLLLASIAMGAVSAAAQQSLGEIARQNRAKNAASPAPKKVITNDDLGVPPEGRPAAKSESASDAAGAAKESSKDAAKTDAKDEGAGDPAALLAEYKQKVSEQKQKIDLLEREYNVALRENQIKDSEYYADAGSRLRNEQQWSQQQAKLRTEMDAKKKALADARQQLANIIEEARKAGVPTSQLQ